MRAMAGGGWRVVVALVFGASALAPAPLRAEMSPPTRVCEPAVAAYDRALRKSPLGMVNESAATVFVTCGFPGSLGPYAETFRAEIVLRNTTHAPAKVTCTLADGGTFFDTPTWYTKYRRISAATVGEGVRFTAREFGRPGFNFPSVSCALPPGIGISLVTDAVRVEQDPSPAGAGGKETVR